MLSEDCRMVPENSRRSLEHFRHLEEFPEDCQKTSEDSWATSQGASTLLHIYLKLRGCSFSGTIQGIDGIYVCLVPILFSESALGIVFRLFWPL